MSAGSLAQQTSSGPREGARRLWPFYVGAAADIAVGLDLLVFAPDIAQRVLPGQATVFGFAAESVMRFLGAFLILFAAETILVARPRGGLARFRSWIVAANWATVALAIVVLALWHSLFSAIGILAVGVVGAAVGVLAYLQGRALSPAGATSLA